MDSRQENQKGDKGLAFMPKEGQKKRAIHKTQTNPGDVVQIINIATQSNNMDAVEDDN
ncbi:MAG: hypothetical protein ABWY13_20425 [Mesorhizobium sp.]